MESFIASASAVRCAADRCPKRSWMRCRFSIRYSRSVGTPSMSARTSARATGSTERPFGVRRGRRILETGMTTFSAMDGVQFGRFRRRGGVGETVMAAGPDPEAFAGGRRPRNSMHHLTVLGAVGGLPRVEPHVLQRSHGSVERDLHRIHRRRRVGHAPGEAEREEDCDENSHDRSFRQRTDLRSLPISAGLRVTLMPHASITESFSCAVPLPPEMIAPAWPMRLPGGAVRPAMNPTTGFFMLSFTQ